jgi:hypothetical protein
VNQLAFDLSVACAAKAERVAGFDREGAKQFVLGYLRRHGPTPGETLVDEAVKHGYRVHDTRAYGAVFLSLSRHGHIRHAGFCDRQKGHGTAGGRIWEAV